MTPLSVAWGSTRFARRSFDGLGRSSLFRNAFSETDGRRGRPRASPAEPERSPGSVPAPSLQAFFGTHKTDLGFERKKAVPEGMGNPPTTFPECLRSVSFSEAQGKASFPHLPLSSRGKAAGKRLLLSPPASPPFFFALLAEEPQLLEELGRPESGRHHTASGTLQASSQSAFHLSIALASPLSVPCPNTRTWEEHTSLALDLSAQTEGLLSAEKGEVSALVPPATASPALHR